MRNKIILILIVLLSINGKKSFAQNWVPFPMTFDLPVWWLNVDTIDKQLFIFKEIKEKGLSVRQTEALVRNMYKQGGGVKKSSKSHLSPAFQRIEDKLASHFGTRVKLKHSRNGSGQIFIEYYSQEELNKILKQMDAPLD